METPKLTPDVELFHRNKLKTDILTVEHSGAVFTKPTFFSSHQDFIEEIGKQVSIGDDLEVQFCQITFLGYEDDEDDGCEENPAVTLKYRIHLFHQFVQQRSDGTNSHDTFAALLINLRNKFLRTIEQSGNVERRPLAAETDIITNYENEFFAGAYGHYCSLITKIEVD